MWMFIEGCFKFKQIDRNHESISFCLIKYNIKSSMGQYPITFKTSGLNHVASQESNWIFCLFLHCCYILTCVLIFCATCLDFLMTSFSFLHHVILMPNSGFVQGSGRRAPQVSLKLNPHGQPFCHRHSQSISWQMLQAFLSPLAGWSQGSKLAAAVHRKQSPGIRI